MLISTTCYNYCIIILHCEHDGINSVSAKKGALALVGYAWTSMTEGDSRNGRFYVCVFTSHLETALSIYRWEYLISFPNLALKPSLQSCSKPNDILSFVHKFRTLASHMFIKVALQPSTAIPWWLIWLWEVRNWWGLKQSFAESGESKGQIHLWGRTFPPFPFGFKVYLEFMKLYLY